MPFIRRKKQKQKQKQKGKNRKPIVSNNVQAMLSNMAFFMVSPSKSFQMTNSVVEGAA